MVQEHRLHQYYLLLPAVVVTAAQICTDVSLFPKVQHGVRVTSPYFLRTTTTTSSLVACAAECLRRRRCKAFSHQSGACTLLQYDHWSQNLTVLVEDTTFAHGPPGVTVYGGAHDCYTSNEACGPKGTFNIDLSGTGFRLNPRQTWKASGYHPITNVEWVDPARVNVRCGGRCGGCEPEGSLKLELNNS